MDLGKFTEFFTERYGFAFDETGHGRLEHALHARMRATHATSVEAYRTHLHSDPSEVDLLLTLLTIKETYFFREPEHLDLLTSHLLPEILAVEPEATDIKIVSAGCSTGEEPYSIAMAILESREAVPPGPPIKIFGFDLDPNAIHRAREGVYGKSSFRSLPGALRDKYFEPAGPGRYRVRDVVRAGVEFHRLNLVSGGWPGHLDEAHVILYRNVSIYLERSVQRRVFERLSRLLRDQGSLLLSSAETLPHDSGVLQLHELDGVFFFRKNTPRRDRAATPRPGRKAHARAAPTRTSKPVERTAPPIPPRPPRIDERWKEARRLFADRAYHEAMAVVEEVLRTTPEFPHAHSLKAALLVIHRRAEEARRICQHVLDLDPLAVECHLLLGTIARDEGDDASATREFRAAAYADPACWMAHFLLAESYRSHKSIDAARNEYRATAKILEGSNGIACDRHPCMPMPFSPKQILQMCKAQCGRLGEGRG